MSGSFSETLSMDDSDVGKLISDLDLMREDVRAAVAEGLRAGAEVIAAEQRRLAGEISSKLPPAISVGKIETTKKGRLRITCGYLFDDSDNKEPAVIGSVFEFGRPGESEARSDPKRRWYYTRDGKSFILMEQFKGEIQPRPHIRRGFDNKKEEACRVLEGRVNSVIK